MAKYTTNNWHINKIEERNYGRKKFREILPTADCKTTDCDFKAPVCNISSGGAFIVKNGRKTSL